MARTRFIEEEEEEVEEEEEENEEEEEEEEEGKELLHLFVDVRVFYLNTENN